MTDEPYCDLEGFIPGAPTALLCPGCGWTVAAVLGPDFVTIATGGPGDFADIDDSGHRECECCGTDLFPKALAEEEREHEAMYRAWKAAGRPNPRRDERLADLMREDPVGTYIAMKDDPDKIEEELSR